VSLGGLVRAPVPQLGLALLGPRGVGEQYVDAPQRLCAVQTVPGVGWGALHWQAARCRAAGCGSKERRTPVTISH